MTLPPFVYSRAFWNALSLLVATLAVQLGWVGVLDAAKILAVILAVLELFDIRTELQAKGLVEYSYEDD